MGVGILQGNFGLVGPTGLQCFEELLVREISLTQMDRKVPRANSSCNGTIAVRSPRRILTWLPR